MSDADPDRMQDIVRPAHAVPVAPDERYVSLDILRGVAILGILVMNIYAFAMPFSAYMNPLLMGGNDAQNLGIWFFTHVLFDQKFISIFAMMFGAGLVLMTDRAESKGAKPAPIYFRRQFWLVMIGAVHGYLIWFGDILCAYALIGMLVYLFRKKSPRTLIVVACLLIPVTPLINYGMSMHMAEIKTQAQDLIAEEKSGATLDDEQREVVTAWEEARAMMAPTAEDTQKDLDTHLQGYGSIVAFRIPHVAQMQLFMTLMYGIWRVGGLMLIGMALMKLGVFTGERSGEFYRRLMMN